MPTIQIFINTTRGDIKRAFVKSTAAATTDANPPALVVGNKRDVEVYLVDDAGNYDARSGAVGYSMAFGAGPVGAIPSGGTFTLSDGTNATAAIARNATAAQVQAALNAIDGGAGPFGQQVIVTTGAPGVYTVKFSSTGAVANLIGEGSELTPESTVVVNQSIAGSATVKERQFIRLMREPVVYTDAFTPITNGWSGTLSANNARAIELMAGKSIIATDLDVELTASGGVPETIARGQIAIANEVINPLTLDAEELAIALTIAAGDARYLQRSNDLSDLASASAARGNLGLSNVDNTSDASKPVSTAQQAAIDLKADITALTAETDERKAADNRRAFSGGVATNLKGTADDMLSQPMPSIGTGDFTLYWEGKKLTQGGNFAKSLFRGTNGINDFSIKIDITSGGSYSSGAVTFDFVSGSKSTIYCGAGYFESDATFKFTFDRDGVASVYKNGELGGTVDISGNSNIDLDFTVAEWFNTQHVDWIGRGLAILNTALTSTQAAEIYRDGLQPWLAANPEYRKAEEVYVSDFSAGTDGFVFPTGGTLSGNIDNIGGQNDVLSFTVDSSTTNHRFYRSSVFKKGYIYRVRCRIYNPSSNSFIQYVKLSSGANESESGYIALQTDAWQQIDYVSASAHINTNNRIYIEADNNNQPGPGTGNGTDVIYIKDVEITQVGALANLPLDDDSRQLKDISGNRNDATASEAGVNHLIRKDTHSFRDDHADGTGGSYLIANADILAENEVITGVTMDGRFYAATEAQDLTKRRIKLVTSGSHIEIKRSNGTTDDAANVTTHPASTTDFAVNVLTQRI
jgi:hypothetical protein